MTKEGYSDSLKELEKISEEIHQRRAERQKTFVKNSLSSPTKLVSREQGVGAENPSPPPKLKDKKNGNFWFIFKVGFSSTFSVNFNLFSLLTFETFNLIGTQTDRNDTKVQ